MQKKLANKNKKVTELARKLPESQNIRDLIAKSSQVTRDLRVKLNEQIDRDFIEQRKR